MVTYVDFATCERGRALDYLRQTLPDAELYDSRTSIGPFLDLVEGDIVRVQDPLMYGKRIAINPGKKWDEKWREKVMEAAQPLFDAQTALDEKP